MSRAFLFLALSGCVTEVRLTPTPVVIQVVEVGDSVEDDTDAPASADTDVAPADTDADPVKDLCTPWDLWSRYPYMRLNPRYSASLPSVEFGTVGVYYPAVTHAMSVGEGTFHVADGCGDGYSVPDVYFLLEGVPADVPVSDMWATFSFEGGPSVEVQCESYWLGNESKYTCSVLGLGDQLLVEAGHQGLKFHFGFTGLPDAPLSQDLQLSMFFRWKDVGTNAGTWTGQNWPAIDSEVMMITPSP